jgi:phosphoribosylglycinamide formyltransferase 1
VCEGDSPESLAARILVAEHKLYPEALALVAAGRTRLGDGRVVVLAAATMASGQAQP